ncbi:hypothetical protein [Sphingobacterium mizutaii]|uniref:hypothetical protein n=1 Tax=Sphingobacterium mizutaii TaxID=1010 RepID=UPI001628CD38|nr:hypothetical protein [Sphingobacterium mizutaii]
MPTAFINDRCKGLQGLPENLPRKLAEGVYSPLYDEKWIRQTIWPTLEELGKALADQHLRSKPTFFSDLKVQRQGVELEFENDEAAIVVFREYISPSLLLSFGQGKRGVVDVFNLKRIAGRIGYVKTGHYSAEAETLDKAILKMRAGYKKIIDSAQPSNEAAAIKEPEPSFSDWLAKHKNRNSPLGDLATKRGFTDKSQPWPLYDSIEQYEDYLLQNHPPLGALHALKRAWTSYQVYLRKGLPKPIKKSKRSSEDINDTRKIMFVKNVKPLHYSERTIENFVPGDKAWVSWNGRKAIPVTVLETDERYYTFRIERPLNHAGDEHYVRLDELRSTPELACINHVS